MQITGKWTAKQCKVAMLVSQVKSLQAKFTVCNPMLVPRYEIIFAFKLARDESGQGFRYGIPYRTTPRSEREAAIPEWASEPCIMGINEAGRGPVLGPMVYGCLYCTPSYQNTLSSLNFADSKTLKEEKREELFENLKADESIGWAVDVIDPRELSAKMLKKLVLNMGVLLTEDPGLSADETALREWVLEETAEELHKGFGSGYPGDPSTKAWLEHNKHFVFGFPSLVRFLRIS
nr:ribonuclease H2 subunit A-like [Malus domestica]